MFHPSLIKPGHDFADIRLAFLCLMISGWINPVFLLYLVMPTALLRRMVLCVIPLCWIFFFYERLIPREGHFLWLLGMLLVLF